MEVGVRERGGGGQPNEVMIMGETPWGGGGGADTVQKRQFYSAVVTAEETSS